MCSRVQATGCTGGNWSALAALSELMLVPSSSSVAGPFSGITWYSHDLAGKGVTPRTIGWAPASARHATVVVDRCPWWVIHFCPNTSRPNPSFRSACGLPAGYMNACVLVRKPTIGLPDFT